MPLVIVAARERTVWNSGNAPSAASIDAAFSRVRMPAGLRWLSRPRIVRHLFALDEVPFERAGLFSYAVAPVESTLTDSTSLRRALHALLDSLDAALASSATGWAPATVAPYTLDANGPPSFWTSGEAQRTASRDAEAGWTNPGWSATNRVDPFGPGRLANPPTAGERLSDVADAAREGVRQVAGTVLPLGALALGALALVLLTSGARRSNPAPRRALPNPRGTPKLWYVAQPGTSYPCRSRAVGRVVSGRGGGRVAACATPTTSGPAWLARQVARGEKSPRPRGPSRYHIVRPSGGELRTDRRSYLSRAVVNRRLRDADAGRKFIPGTDDQWLVEGYRDFQRFGLPLALGVPWPHREGSSPCDEAHPTWKGYRKALEAIEPDALEEADAGTDEHTRALARLLRKKSPKSFAKWTATTERCATQYRDRVEQRRALASTKSSRTRALRRRAAEMDPGLDEREIFGDYVEEIIEAERDSSRRGRR